MKFEKLGNIAEVIAGQSPKSETYNQNGDGLPFFQGKTDFGEMYPKARYWCNEPTKIASPNDILMSVRAPVGPVNICNIESCIGRGLGAIRVNENISKDYVYYFLKANEKQIANLGVGSTFKAITQREIRNIVIPLPTFENQIRIANIISKAEVLIKQRQESIDLLDEYLKSTFLEMFGDPMRNERNWNKEFVGKYTDCIVPGRDKPKSFTGTTPWFTTADLIHKGFVIKSKNNLGLSDFEIKEVKAKRIPVGSVIMTCVGDLGVLSINKEVCIVNQQLHAFLCKPQINNIFLMYNLSFMTSYMYKMASTTTVPYMNKTICNSIPVILPDINLQTKFANIVEKTESLKAQCKSSLDELENLYGSLSQKAFKGELNLEEIEDVNDMNSVIKDAVKYALTIQEHYKTIQDISQIGDSFKKDVDNWNKLIVPIQNLPLLPKEILKTQELIRNLQTNIPIVNPAIVNALQLANTLNENYNRFKDVSLLGKSFQNQIENWNKAFEPIKNLTVLPQEIINFQRKMEMLQSPRLKVFIDEKQKQRKLTWGNVSFKQIAELIIEAYEDNYFNNEMLVKYMIDEQVIFPNYYSSEELKKSPKLNESDDYKSFIFTALRNENPFFKLEQFFYDGIDENFLLKLREEDYDSSKSPKDYSGIYFKIIE